MLLSQGKCPGLFFLQYIKQRRKKKAEKRINGLWARQLVFSEIRHINYKKIS